MKLTQQEQDDLYRELDNLYGLPRREMLPGEFTVAMEMERTGLSDSTVRRAFAQGVAANILEVEEIITAGKRTMVFRRVKKS